MSYQAKIEALEAVDPGHKLLGFLRRNESQANELILDNILLKLPDPSPIAPGAVLIEAENEAETPDPVEDETLRRLRMQQSTLFGERRKHSNEFHNCATDAQRAVVSDRVQIVQARIESVRDQIRTYKEQGRLPEPDEKYPVPEDPIRLIALRDSLRSSISRKSRQIGRLGIELLDNKPGAPDRLDKAEAKIKELKNHLTHVQKAVKHRNLFPVGLQGGGQG